MLILRNPALIAFEAIANVGTVHGAAKNLKLTQTALTLRIKKLEQELGLTLFLRSRRGMALTSEGKALLQLCRSQKELEGQFISQVSGSARQEISISLAGPTSTLSARIAPVCTKLYRDYPFLNLNLVADDHTDLIAMIRKGSADLAIVPPSAVPQEMESKLLKPEKYILVCSSKWKNRKLAEILEYERIVDFYDSDATTQKYLKHFKLEKGVKRGRLFVNNNDALIHFFKSEIGFGTLTESVAAPHLASGALIKLN